jgi:dihydroorotate dehydrogenase electron transfer subunit
MGRHYLVAKLTGSRMLTADVCAMEFSLDEWSDCRAGQYYMVWLPGQGEIPLSPSTCRGRAVEFLVEAVGPTSSALASMSQGSSCFIRGAFGRPFSLDRDGPYLLVAGGTGVAPLLLAAEQLSEARKRTHVIIGASNAGKLYYARHFAGIAETVTLVTEDGSQGLKGKAPDRVAENIAAHNVKTVLTAGPELMMRAVVELSERLGVYSEASLVRIIKCAEGVCGSCVLDPRGQLVCKEGPVIPGSELLRSEFGSRTRDSAGRSVDVT